MTRPPFCDTTFSYIGFYFLTKHFLSHHDHDITMTMDDDEQPKSETDDPELPALLSIRPKTSFYEFVFS